MVEVAHHQPVQHTLTLQPPMAQSAFVVFLVANSLQHLLGLIQYSRQRVFLVLCLFEATAGLKPAVPVNLVCRVGTLR